MAMTGRFEERVAVVTGAGSGIGRATALRLAAEGATVACLDLDGDAANATCTTIEAESGGSALGLTVDVTDEGQVSRSFGQVRERLGSVDVLIANAGIEGPVDTIPNIERSAWEQVVAVNLTGVFLCAKHAIPLLCERAGSMVITCSNASAAAVPRWGAYNATKGGVLSLTRSLAIDHAPDGIRVNCVCPGAIATPLLARGFAIVGGGGEAEAEAAIAARGRIGKPEEIAAVIAFLASSDASLVNGAALFADGGASAHLGVSWPSASYWA
jgi:NAD(P)-dependent dehydrogenase (short-subunit alcohol dehydrogenase family)